jgi:hypothetical protein
MVITKKDITEMVMNENGLWDNIRAKRKRGEKPAKPGDEDYPDKKGWDKAVAASKNEGDSSISNTNYGQEIKNGVSKMKAGAKEIGGSIVNGIMNVLSKEEKGHFTNKNVFALIDEIITMETGEAVIDDLSFTDKRLCEGIITPEILENVVNDALYEYYSMTESNINEAEYRGKKVSLGKISRGDVKKYKVFVKNSKGNVVKVNFGDPNMEIRRDNPERRKNFRARHHCDNPGPRWKARYWACRTWSRKPVSKMV